MTADGPDRATSGDAGAPGRPLPAPDAEATQAPVAVVVTQLGAAEPVAAACAIAGLGVDAVLSGIGVLVVCRDTAPGEPQRVAETLTRAMAGVSVLLLERRDDRITAHRWRDGVQGDQVPAGLALDGAPEALSNLLLGIETVGDLPGVVSSVGMGRLKAARTLTALARGARKAGRKAARQSAKDAS